MTLESTQNQNRYVGNGVAKSFAFTFKVWKKSQVSVLVGDGSTESEVSSHCDISITATGGSVTFSTPPENGRVIVIRRSMPFTQEDDYRNGTRFDSEEIEDRFDQDCAERQDLKLDIGRAIKIPNTSSLNADGLVQALLDAATMMQESGDVSGASLVKPDGATVYRALASILGDLVSVKNYGAAGDGATDDSAAWAAWQTALEAGGVGYVPAGTYLVSGVRRHFPHGCIGNAKSIDWDSYMLNPDTTNPETSFAHAGTEAPVLRQYQQYSGDGSWSPLVELSFDADSTRDFVWSDNSPGPMGVEVKGAVKGSGNPMPIGVRSVVETAVDGDGDAVALWGRVFKTDPDSGTNDSDACAMHSSVICSDSGSGMGMAGEFWAACEKAQGSAGTAYSSYFDAGGVVCQHIVVNGVNGMVQAGQLFNGNDSADYGAWSAITLNNDFWKYNGSAAHPANTAAIKAATLGTSNGPESFLHLGWCPKHFKMAGGYDFNVFSNCTSCHSNEKDSDCYIEAIDQRKSDSVESAKPNTGFRIVSRSYGGEAHAPNYGGTKTVLLDIYNERGNANTFYRARNQNSTHHVFHATNGSGTLGEVLNVFHSTVRPGRDNDQQLGDSTKRWSTVFAGTGSINTSDERLKDNIESPSEALMRAWGRVSFKVFQFKDAIEKKGVAEARLHVGVIAQEVQAAFEAEGLDAFRYGLLCKDEWDAVPQKIQRHWVEDEVEKRDADGNLVEAAKGHYEDFVENPGREAGDIYSIRYEEALALECAYQRWRLNQIEARLSAMEVQ